MSERAAVDLAQTPAAWDASAADYERAFDSFTAQYAEEALRLTGFVPEWRILDVAAGCGSLSIMAAKRGANVVSIDFSPVMIDRLRARAAREGVTAITAEVMDGQALRFPDDSFDAAYSVFGLIFFPDRQRGFREIRRVLKPGGRAAVVAWSRSERLGWVPPVRRAMQTAVPGFVAPLRAWQEIQDRAVFEDEIRRAGFEQVAVIPVSGKWTVPSAKWFWSNFRSMSPANAVLFETFTDEEVLAFGRAFIAGLRNGLGDGPIVFEAEALVGLGQK